MKGIASSIHRGLPIGARLNCVDNSGAKIVQIIMVPGRMGTKRKIPSAGIGDMVIVSVKKGKIEMRNQIFYAIIVRQRAPIRRPDGTRLEFEDNAVVITTPKGETKGSVIKGAVAKEAAERWPRIAATSSIIV